MIQQINLWSDLVGQIEIYCTFFFNKNSSFWGKVDKNKYIEVGVSMIINDEIVINDVSVSRLDQKQKSFLQKILFPLLKHQQRERNQATYHET